MKMNKYRFFYAQTIHSTAVIGGIIFKHFAKLAVAPLTFSYWIAADLDRFAAYRVPLLSLLTTPLTMLLSSLGNPDHQKMFRPSEFYSPWVKYNPLNYLVFAIVRVIDVLRVLLQFLIAAALLSSDIKATARLSFPLFMEKMAVQVGVRLGGTLGVLLGLFSPVVAAFYKPSKVYGEWENEFNDSSDKSSYAVNSHEISSIGSDYVHWSGIFKVPNPLLFKKCEDVSTGKFEPCLSVTATERMCFKLH